MVSSAIGAAPQSSAASEAETNFTSEHLHEDSDLEEEAAEAAAGPDFSGDNDEGDEDPQEVEEFRTPLDEHSHLHKSPVLNRTPSVGGGGGGLMFTTSQSESNDFVSEDQNRDQGARNNEDTPEDTNRTPSRTLTTSLLRMNTQEAQREDSPETVLVGSMRSERSRTVERTPPVPGPPKVRVVVNDVAYSTYRAVLYYVSYNFLQFPRSNRKASSIRILLFLRLWRPVSFIDQSDIHALKASESQLTCQSILHEMEKSR